MLSRSAFFVSSLALCAACGPLGSEVDDTSTNPDPSATGTTDPSATSTGDMPQPTQLPDDPGPLTGVEVPGANCPVPTLPEFAALTAAPTLPNPFVLQDGTPVTTRAQWTCRHRELRAMFEKYETGPKTEKPAEVTGSIAGGTLTVNVSDGAGKTASFDVTITYPTSGNGPFPAMIGLGGGSLNNGRFQSQGVATINFPVNAVRPEGDRNGGAYTAFTGQTAAGSLIAWSWGVSRVIDALESTPDANIKADRLGITGCSRLGKGALMIGAMDSRIALTIPQESGSGGTAAWRAAEAENTAQPQGCENPTDPTRCVQKLSSTYTETQWFGTSIAQFSAAVDKLPVDHHELIAMAAPRGLLALGNIGWRWLGRYGTIQSMSAAREVYESLGVVPNIGFVESGHQHCAQDYTGQEQAAIDAFVAKFLLDQEVSTDFWNQGVAFEAERWVDWQTPVMQ
jgi:hypothetical protein